MTESGARRQTVQLLAKLVCDMPVAMLTTGLPDRSMGRERDNEDGRAGSCRQQ